MLDAIYIHIPFCKNICTYCDFCKLYYCSSNRISYLKTLSNEVELNYKNEAVETIYIGGGTPSCLSIDELNILFSITNKINLKNTYEFTFECNVEDITEEKLSLLKQNRVNRLSIGVQTFNNNLLKYLGRKTSKEQIITNIKLAQMYFDNISIDLIYAIPNQSIKNIKTDLKYVKKLKLNHVSLYSLIIEPHTKLYINNTNYIDDSLDYNMYKLIQKKLKKYNNYEISNYAYKGFESIHNLKYWTNKEYYGFGLGASGFVENIRYTNTKNINKYLVGEYVLEKHILTKEENIQNELIFGLRKLKGIDINLINTKYKIDLLSMFNIKKLINEKKLVLNSNKLKISKNYIYLSNDIFINFI